MAKVLIVDDDVELSQFLEAALRRKGHEVKAATSRFDAYTLGVEFRPDVLVVDWLLAADVDGVELAEVLRAGLPQLQVILITGYPSEALERDAAAADIWPVLAKPFDLEELTAAIDEAVTRGSSSS
jgi:two-component system OmpR family response regulator